MESIDLSNLKLQRQATPVRRLQRFSVAGGALVLILGAFVLYLASMAQGPDVELRFQREIRSAASPVGLELALQDIRTWPKWFHSLAEVSFEDSAPATGAATEPGELLAGRTVKMLIDPQKGPWKKFELNARITQLIPGRLLVLRVLEDSTGRLTSLFDGLEWKVELLPGPGGGTLVRGEATARTRHWRSRLFGRTAERILMNQIYYPNLFKLAALGADSSAAPPDYLRQK